ncbi:hypothetical protein MMC30_000491 [Trapelia coarctata]|nr:hypothetical protein [Trapelia coarctata]
MDVGEREPRRGQDLGGLDTYDGRYEFSARRSDSSLPNMRKSTFSAALNKFSTLTRRKTSSDDNLMTINSMNPHSRIPTPGGLSHSTSFFMSRFSAKTQTQADPNGKKNGKPSTRHAQRASWVQREAVSAPATPPILERRRESSMKITQHKLMAPIPPPIPQSKRLSLVGNPTTPSSSPGYLRSTSSSLAKRRERVVSSEKHGPSSKTPTSHERRQRAAEDRKRAEEITRYSQPLSEIGRPASKIPTSAIRSRHRVRSSPKQNSVSEQTPKVKGIATPNNSPTMEKKHGNSDIPKVREQRTARYYYEATAEEEAVARGCSDFPILRPITSGRITQIRRIERTLPPSTSIQSNLTFAQRAAPIHIYGLDDDFVTMMPTTALDHLLNSTKAVSPSSPDSEETLGSGGSRISTPNPRGLDGACLESCPTLIHTPIDGPMADQWWLGRVFALADHFKTDELDKPAPRMTPEPSITGGIQTDSVRPKRSMLDDNLRNRRVFIRLKNLCSTDEARESLKGFKFRFDNRLVKEAEWESGASAPLKKGDKGKRKAGSNGQEGDIKEKLSVLEKLKMRKNKAFKKSVTQGSSETSGNGA